MRKLLVAIFTVAALSACSGGEDMPRAEAAVARFHQHYDAGKLQQIYATSSDAMKEASPEAEFTRFLTAVRTKLGSVREAKQQGWRVNYGSSGGTVELSYQTRFERGSGTEGFVFQTGGEAPKLAGYHINSRELVIN